MAATRMRLVLALILITSMVTGQNGGCPVQCRSCDGGRVMCSRAGLVTFPKSLPEESLTIDLTQNRITTLKGLPSLPNTMSLKLAGNQLSVIEGRVFTKIPQMMSLDLSMNQIRKVYKLGFKGLDNVMTITLNGNAITSIGKMFMFTPALTTLRLSFNKITEIGEDTFENNKMLKMLDLSNNAINKIHPKAFAKLDMLRILLLSNNPLGTLPELTFITNILTLADFTNCELTAVPRIMPASLKDFRLGNNRITKINANDFKNNTELVLLTLNDNQISDVEHRSFYYLESLKDLWMSRNLMVYIPRGLPMHLEKFHIDNNQVVEFESMLFKPDSMLKMMSLEANKVHKIHREALKEIKQIESLSLQGNQISTIEHDTFINLDNLQSLTLSNNPIQKIQTGAFGSLHNLTDLSMAHIYTEGQKTPGDKILNYNMLSSTPNLKNLDLMSSVDLTMDLIAALDENAKPLDKLESVNLQYNDMESLPESVKHVFGNAGKLLLDGNIFVCDKRLRWLNRWMKSSVTQFAEYEQPSCHSSGDLDGRQITDLSENEFIEVANQNQEAINQNNDPNPQGVHANPELRAPVNKPDEPKPEDRAPVNKPEEHKPQEAAQQPKQQQGLQTLSGSRRQPPNGKNSVSKYDNQPAAGSNKQPQRGNAHQPQGGDRRPPQPSNSRGNYIGTRVLIKPPAKDNSKSPPAKKVSWSKLSKKEKELRKAARKAKRQQDRAARRKARQNNRRAARGERRGRRKRRTRKQCTQDENGVIKCERRRSGKRCKVQDDGSMKCRKRKGGKRRKSRKEKKQKADETKIQ